MKKILIALALSLVSLTSLAGSLDVRTDRCCRLNWEGSLNGQATYHFVDDYGFLGRTNNLYIKFQDNTYQIINFPRDCEVSLNYDSNGDILHK